MEGRRAVDVLEDGLFPAASSGKPAAGKAWPASVNISENKEGSLVFTEIISYLCNKYSILF